MLMPGRSYSSDSYRFGFNGKENDNEVKGTGNQQDYGMRIYDPRAVRFLSVDPLTGKYPYLTPYAFAENDLIRCVDLDGKERVVTTTLVISETSQISITTCSEIPGMLGEGVLNNIINVWTGEVHSTFTEPLVVGSNGEITGEKTYSVPSNVAFPIGSRTEQGSFSKPGLLQSTEIWLSSPSENIWQGTMKIAGNIAYDAINAPYSLLNGQTLAGSELNSAGKVDAFISTVPGLISLGLTQVKEIVKVGKGLQGYNKFVKEIPGVKATEGLPTGMTWQERAGNLFQKNKVNQGAVSSSDNGLFTTGVVSEGKKEVEK
jgi:RHS repeat-associated protein